MKAAIIIPVLLLSALFLGNTPDPKVLRENFALAPNDKKICQSMIAALKVSQQSLDIAYLGAFQTMWAKHVGNPFTKLKSFNAGKQNIEKAVHLSPTDVEIVFIRHAVQQNSPAFLGYKDDIERDRDFLYSHLHEVRSGLLRARIEELLKEN
jgi:hypothetical protein